VCRLLGESVGLALEAGELRPKLGEAHYQPQKVWCCWQSLTARSAALNGRFASTAGMQSRLIPTDNLAPVSNMVADMQLRLRQEAQYKAGEAVLSYDAQFDDVSARHKELELQRVALSDFIAHNRLSDSGIIDLADKATKDLGTLAPGNKPPS